MLLSLTLLALAVQEPGPGPRAPYWQQQVAYRIDASLDEPSRYRPQMVTYRVRGEAWDRVDPGLPGFDRMPSQ